MTSSPNSSSDIPNGVDSVGTALADVAERSFFAFADACDRAAFDEAVAALPEPHWQVAVLSFSGDPSGTMCCAVPAALTAQLFDSFTGRSPEEPEPSAVLVNDLLGEFLNMVCGAWLSHVPSSTVFELSRPTVASMPNGWNPWCTLAPTEFASWATIDGMPVMVLVHLEEGNLR